jgi:DNA-binding IclR family transcriptional regulator
VVVRYPDGRTAGALSLSAIDSRMGLERQKTLAALLQGEASRLTSKLERLFARNRDGRAGKSTET